MVVYADVLVTLNLFVNFFILQFTCRLCKESPRFGRIILSALIGSGFSLYIFLPPTGMLVETVFRLVVSTLIVLLAFGFSSITLNDYRFTNNIKIEADIIIGNKDKSKIF